MTNLTASGMPAKASPRAGTLSCTEDGVWLWPGIALTQKRGNEITPLLPQDIYAATVIFHGPEANYSTLPLATGSRSDRASLVVLGHRGARACSVRQIATFDRRAGAAADWCGGRLDHLPRRPDVRCGLSRAEPQPRET